MRTLLLMLALFIPMMGTFAMAEKPKPTVGYDGFILDADVSKEEMQAQAEYLAKKYNYDLDKLIAIVKKDNPKAIFATGVFRESQDKPLKEFYGFIIEPNLTNYLLRYSIQFDAEPKTKKFIKVTTVQQRTGP